MSLRKVLRTIPSALKSVIGLLILILQRILDVLQKAWPAMLGMLIASLLAGCTGHLQWSGWPPGASLDLQWADASHAAPVPLITRRPATRPTTTN